MIKGKKIMRARQIQVLTDVELKAKADEGNREAQYIYGKQCLDQGLAADGIAYLESSAEQGHPLASVYIAAFLVEGQCALKDESRQETLLLAKKYLGNFDGAPNSYEKKELTKLATKLRGSIIREKIEKSVPEITPTKTEFSADHSPSVKVKRKKKKKTIAAKKITPAKLKRITTVNDDTDSSSDNEKDNATILPPTSIPEREPLLRAHASDDESASRSVCASIATTVASTSNTPTLPDEMKFSEVLRVVVDQVVKPIPIPLLVPTNSNTKLEMHSQAYILASMEAHYAGLIHNETGIWTKITGGKIIFQPDGYELQVQDIPEEILKVMYTLYQCLAENNLSGHCYIVGGWVRDTLLNVKSIDFDIVFPAEAECFLDKYFQNLKKTSLQKKFGEKSLYQLKIKNLKIDLSPSPYLHLPDQEYALRMETLNRDFKFNAIFVDTLGRVMPGVDNTISLIDGNFYLNKKAETIIPLDNSIEEDPLRLPRYSYFIAQGFFPAYNPDDMKQLANKLLLLPKEARETIFFKHFTKGNAEASLNILLDHGIFQQYYPELNAATLEWVRSELRKLDKTPHPSKYFVKALFLVATLDQSATLSDLMKDEELNQLAEQLTPLSQFPEARAKYLEHNKSYVTQLLFSKFSSMRNESNNGYSKNAL